MEVYFATKKLAEATSSDAAMTRAFGPVMAKRISLRLAQLADADTLEVMRRLPGGCHELRENRRGQLALDLTGNMRLVFKPAADPVPERPGGGLDWSAVAAVTILEVTDYHGK